MKKEDSKNNPSNLLEIIRMKPTKLEWTLDKVEVIVEFLLELSFC